MQLHSLISKGYLLTILSLLLIGCGGGGNDDSSTISDPDATSRPTFSRELAKASTVFQPVGDIQDTSPTFKWKANKEAVAYQFGHEDTDTEMRWQVYRVTPTEASCETADICYYTPNDLKFAIGDEKVWWLRADTSNGWQEWSSPYIFTITNGMIDLPSSKPISPEGIINTVSPTFRWTPGNGASSYQIGMENFDETDWIIYTVSADQAHCETTECSFTPNPSALSNGDRKTWWVREEISGIWQNWSQGSIFSIETNTSYLPFENISDITNVIHTSGKWYGILGTEILEDDGQNIITTIYTNQYGYDSTLSGAITGKLYFVSVKEPSTQIGNMFGPDRVEELHSLTLDTEQDEIIIVENNVSIVESLMKNFVIVGKKRIPSNATEAQTSPFRYYKIDRDANVIFLGSANPAGFSAANNSFSIESVDYPNNIVRVKILSRPEITYKIVTDAINIGLEEE